MSLPATCEPGLQPAHLEEQDYVQAYENVREKYKGNTTTLCWQLETEIRPGCEVMESTGGGGVWVGVCGVGWKVGVWVE